MYACNAMGQSQSHKRGLQEQLYFEANAGWIGLVVRMVISDG
jgi:hypothetical protein